MKNHKGFTLVEGLLIVLVLSVLGFAGYYVWSQQNNDDSEETTAQLEQVENKEQTEESKENSKANSQEVVTEITQDKYIIKLPEGWKEDKNTTAPAGAPETYHQYSNNSGQTIGVSINSGGFGGGGDGSASFEVIDGRLSLDQNFKACDPAVDETGACRFGDGNLYLIVSSTDDYNGDNYMFWLWDENSEDQISYSALKNIVETIELK